MFFSFDGLDGSGKSTQIEQFCDWLSAAGRDVVRCQDPGSTPLGEQIRALLLQRRDTPIGSRAEMLLFMAARAQLVEAVVAPALAAGRTVVSDRFLLANVVYQGYGGGLDVDALWRIGEVATAGLRPDLTFVLDLAPEAAARRLARPLDRMESRGREYVARLRAGYLAEAARQPKAIAVLDADRPIDAVQADIRRLAQALFEQRGAAS